MERIVSSAVHAERVDRRVGRENLVGPVALMNVEVDDQGSGDPT